MEEQKQIPLLPVLSVNFIGMLGYSIIMPFLIFIVQRFEGNEFMYGLLASVYPLFQFFGAPLLGKWSDNIGRKRVLLISQIGTLMAWIIFLIALYLPLEQIFSIPMAGNEWMILTLPMLFLFLARAIDGITGGNISVANAYLADISTDENRKSNFGKMGMSSSLGFIIGPALAGVLGSTILGETLPVLMAILISLVAAILIWKRLPESRQDLVDPEVNSISNKGLTNEHIECFEMKHKARTSIWRIKGVPFMLVFYFLTFLAFNFFYATFPIYAVNNLEWNSVKLGVFFSVLSICMILVQGPLLSFISGRVNEKTLIIFGTALLIITFIMMSSENEILVWSAIVLFAFGNGTMWPSYLSLLSQVGGKDRQGSIQGYANSAGSLASIIGLIVGGYLFGLINQRVFLLTALFLGFVLIMSFAIRDRKEDILE